MLLLAAAMVQRAERQGLELAREQLRAGAEHYAVSVVGRLEHAVADVRDMYRLGATDESFRLAKGVAEVPGLQLARPHLVAMDRGFELLVPLADTVVRGEVTDTVLFAELGHAEAGVSRCIHIDGKQRLCDRGLGLSGEDHVEATFPVPLATVFYSDFQLSVSAAQPRALALRSAAFVSELLPWGLGILALLCGALVWVFVVMSERPARRLLRAMGNMQEEEYLQYVDISTGDVFERLGV